MINETHADPPWDKEGGPQGVSHCGGWSVNFAKQNSKKKNKNFGKIFVGG